VITINWRSHIGAGVIFLAIILLINHYWMNFLSLSWSNWYYILIYAPLILMYFILPDVDTPSSKIRYIVTVVLLGLIIYFFYMENKFNGITTALFLFGIWILPSVPGFGHRGFFHSLLFAILLSIPIWLILSLELAVICFIAYFSHLLFDGCVKVI